MKLGIGAKIAFFDLLVANHGTSYDGKSEVLTVSLPNLGPKSLDIDSDQIGDFANLIAEYDPEKPETLVETVFRTLNNDGENVTFRVSNDKGARKVTVPAKDWPEFVKFWQAAAGTVEDTIKQYKALNSGEADTE